VLFGVRAVHPSDLYTGSARVLRYDAPLSVLGDEFRVGWGQAEEARLVAGYYATHTKPGEPTLVVPTHPLYWAIVDRPNPTRYLADHAHGHFVMTAAQKRDEADRLRASGARVVLAEQAWYSASEPADPLRTLLHDEFRPVRSYVSMVILERNDSADGRALGAILRRTVLGRPTSADLDALRAQVEQAPDEPLPWKLLGALASSAGETDEALSAYRRAAALDPSDASALERAAALAIDADRRAEAAADLQRARNVRESPTILRLEARLTD
jgi:tetratricopeptide (TPR) repeat protein